MKTVLSLIFLVLLMIPAFFVALCIITFHLAVLIANNITDSL